MLFKNELALCVPPKRKHIQPVKKILLFLGKFHNKLINKSNSIFFLLKVTYFRFSLVTENKDLNLLMYFPLRVVLI